MPSQRMGRQAERDKLPIFSSRKTIEEALSKGKGTHPGTYGASYKSHATDVGASKFTDPTMKSAVKTLESRQTTLDKIQATQAAGAVRSPRKK